jgi:hypothetical protein
MKAILAGVYKCKLGSDAELLLKIYGLTSHYEI